MKNRFKFILERLKRILINLLYPLIFRRKVINGNNNAPGSYLDFFKFAGNWYADVHSWTGSVQNLQQYLGKVNIKK